MDIKQKKIIYGYYNNLWVQYKITDETENFFKEEQLDQGDDKYWRYGVLNNLKNVYVGLISNKKKDLEYPLIISYMVIIKEYKCKFSYIELLDTFYRQQNLSFRMIENYHKKYKNKKLIPLHIIPSSIHFWKKYFIIYFNLISKKDFEIFINENNLLNNKYKNQISWKYFLDSLL